MTRADMRLKLLEQMVLDRDARIAELEALAAPQAGYLALSEKCAKLGELLKRTTGPTYRESQAYRNSVNRDIALALEQ